MDLLSPGDTVPESSGPATLLETNVKSELTSESYLQSLSFTIEDGRAKFKLEEPGSNPFGTNILARAGPSSIDTNDSESFVVLGKSSLDPIQVASMASYAQIQQKSMSTDYNSVISSLSPPEIENKLSELLQENVRLKETLTQNNISMKQQFNTLATWQEEVTKVHQNHKLKFAETRDLINQLRRENIDLKTKLAVSDERDSKIKELEMQLQQALSSKDSERSSRESELEEKVTSLTKELNDWKAKCSKLEWNDFERRASSSSDRMSQRWERVADQVFGQDVGRLESNAMERECTSTSSPTVWDFSLLTRSAMPRDVEIGKCSRKCEQTDKEIDRLRKLVESLEKQLRAANENSFAPVQLNVGCLDCMALSQDHIQLVRNVKGYDEKLRELAKCYTERSSRYTGIHECLNECVNALEIFENTKLSKSYHESVNSDREKSWYSTSEDVKRLEKKLRECHAKLFDEQLGSTSEMRNLIKVQNQLQKIFSDYNSVLYELEIVREENAKLSAIQSRNSVAREALEKIVDIEKRVKEDKKSLDEERNSLDQEKLNFLEEKKSVNDVRDTLEAERKSLIEERLSLDQQNKLYEAERRSLLTEKKALQRTNDSLITKLASLEEDLQSKNATLNNLSAEIEHLKLTTEKISLLKIQTDIYQNDFEEEKSARQMVMHEKDDLLRQLQEVQNCNKSLLKRVDELTGQNVQNSEESTSQSPQQTQLPVKEESRFELVTTYWCPKCGKTFVDVDPLQIHVEECLNLQ